MIRRAFPVILGLVPLLGGCGDERINPVGAGSAYRATIRWTSHGIPHILADDLGSLGFGLGHASARDNVCTLADQIVKVRSERAKFFGPGKQGANVESDFAYLALGLLERAEATLPRLPPDVADLVGGYVAGYNHWLQATGAAGLPAPCAGAAWVQPIRTADLIAFQGDLNLRGSGGAFLDFLPDAAPPGGAAPKGSGPSPELRSLTRSELGSNGWALGRERTATGRGALVANPHFPWEGELRLYESHLTVPGQLDVYGASLTGTPIVLIGFNERVGWTHTVTSSVHFTVYELALAPGDPTAYLYDGELRRMEGRTHTVEVLGEDGSLAPVTRTLYRSHYGPMISGTFLGWTDEQAFSVRDANEDNDGLIAQWLRMDRAESVEDLQRAQEEIRGVPWVHTIAADADGNASYTDASRVPHLSAEALAAYLQALDSDSLTQLLEASGVLLLDGSTSRDEWVVTDGAGALVPPADIPRLVRDDFVMNANGPPWLANPAEPLAGYPFQYGPVRAPLSTRTRMNLVLLTEQGPGSAAGEDGLFSLEELQAAILGNRGITADRLRTAVVARCEGAPPVDVDGRPVDISAACAALAAWDGRLDLDSAGALIWRELLGQFTIADVHVAGALYAEPFDPDDPLATPRTLTPPPPAGPDPILTALAEATLVLGEAGLTAATPLGEAQFTRRGDARIPIHGGNRLEGTTNVVGFTSGDDTTLLPHLEQQPILSGPTQLTAEGYLVNFGTSFLMALEYTDAGPSAAALLSYSQSTDPASPHFADQTERFAMKAWRPVLFREDEIAADPELVVEEVVAPR